MTAVRNTHLTSLINKICSFSSLQITSQWATCTKKCGSNFPTQVQENKLRILLLHGMFLWRHMTMENHFFKDIILPVTEKWNCIDAYKKVLQRHSHNWASAQRSQTLDFQQRQFLKHFTEAGSQQWWMPWTPNLPADQNITCAERVGWTSSAQLLVLQFYFLHSESLCDLISHFISQKYILALLDLERL